MGGCASLSVSARLLGLMRTTIAPDDFNDNEWSNVRPELLPGSDLSTAKRLLDECRMAGVNLRSRGSDAEELLSDYLAWCRSSSDRLALVVSARDISALFLTATYWAMLSMQSAGSIVATTIHAEVDARTRDLEEATERLTRESTRWSYGFGLIVVLDTSVFIEHKDEFPASLAAIEDRLRPARPDDRFAAGTPFQFVIPLQVIDELDRTKADRSRGRAQLSLARLNDIVRTPEEPAPVDGLRDGSRLHLLLDEPGHVRLPVEDDEIVDRALYLSGVVGQGAVGVACLDTGMDLRARVAGLSSHLLSQDRRPEKLAKSPRRDT